MKNRVVITGIGVVSPIGNNIKDLQRNLFTGKNGIDFITLFDTSNHKIKIAGECKINLENYFDVKQLRKIDRFTAFSILSSDQAIKDSQINSDFIPERVGVIMGSGIGGLATFETQHKKLLEHPKKVSPFFIPAMIPDIAPGHISIKYNFQGPNYSVASACATASHAIGDAFRLIQYGDADVIVCGGSDATITPMGVSGFANMKALSTHKNPTFASRPFDLNRNGFVIAEGGGTVILEELNHAINRNAKIYGEIIGYGASADAYHLTAPEPSGKGASLAMKKALSDAKISYDKIDYINAHGTSTKLNDRIETMAIKKVFKDYSKQISISSTKSMMGHLLGAAGAVELIICLLAMKEKSIPPTINYEHSDIDCDLNYTPNEPIKRSINYCMSNNFGFGGHNSSLIVKK